MPEAISAINLAAQYAPDQPFVQRTAGEILAWYDVKADKTRISENARTGLDKTRALLDKTAAFTQAYNTAKQAYQAQASAESSQQYGAQPGVTAPAYAPTYDSTQVAQPLYMDYDSGPGWIQPAPCGFFSGFFFVPSFSVIVLNNHEFFEHHHFDHRHDFFDHADFFFNKFGDHRSAFFRTHVNDSVIFQPGIVRRSGFFGMPARPNPTVVLSAQNAFRNGVGAPRFASPNAFTPSGMPVPMTGAPSAGRPAFRTPARFRLMAQLG